MGIYTTMYNGLSGISLFGDNMSVLADNIANLNTTAFKIVPVHFRGGYCRCFGARYNSRRWGPAQQYFRAISRREPLTPPTCRAIWRSVAMAFSWCRQDAASPDLYTRDGQFSLQQRGDSQDVLNLVNALGYYVQGYDIDPAAGSNGNDVGDISSTGSAFRRPPRTCRRFSISRLQRSGPHRHPCPV